MSGFGRTVVRLRSLLLIPLVTLAAGLSVILLSLFDKGGKSVHRIVARRWGTAVMRLAGVHLTVEHLERIKGEGPFIVVVNHQSYLDIPILFAALPLQIRFIAKAELARIPVFGQAMRRLGHIIIDRARRAEAVSGLEQAQRRMREGGISVVIAPEGTRSPDGRLLPFKKGAFVLALETGIPILPVTITGTHEVMPKKAFLPVGGAVTVRVEEPVETGNLAYGDRDRLRERIRSLMEERLAEIRRTL